jgi:hypothetical protein
MSSLPGSIFKRWIHSREEDTGENVVYRPAGYRFPPARGREGIEFREDGAFVHYVIGPTDRSQAVKGQWKSNEPKIIEVSFPDQSSSPYKLVIVKCSDDMLIVKKRPN